MPKFYIKEESTFQTSDMSLVTYLRLCGFEPEAVLWESGTCVWSLQYEKGDGMLEKAEEYMTGKAKVEPRQYNDAYQRTKRELFRARPGQAS